jgi:4-hydroxybenzoate polyprenyltransferase
MVVKLYKGLPIMLGMKGSQIVAVLCTIVLIANILLFALQKISTLTFWGTIIVIGIIAYKGVPWLKSSQK